METIQTQQEDQKKRSKLPVILLGATLGLLAAGYVGLCAYSSSLHTFYPNELINGVEIGGLTPAQAATFLADRLSRERIFLRLSSNADDVTQYPNNRPMDAAVTYGDLGVTEAMNFEATTNSLYTDRHDQSFFQNGGRYALSLLHLGNEIYLPLKPDADALSAESAALAHGLSKDAVDTSYELGEDTISITNAKDGIAVQAEDISQALTDIMTDPMSRRTNVNSVILPAVTMTAQEIYDEVSGEMKNAGYDAATSTITPEQVGADFDVARAQQLMDAADPGEVVELEATVQQPAVTKEELRKVLFRDKLGSHTTHVGGSSARIGNVKLSSAAVNGIVLNSGDVFDYNLVVGQRTAARGYLPAPAYVKGETVDEIGGGVCQPSSTLYLACLKANLEIVERYAHRYVPAYIPKGMDATVSWGGPNYLFRNDTDFPVRVEAIYSKNYLTMTLYGTNVDGVSVKMTNKVLSTTPFKTVFEDDATLPAGTQKRKVSPYTGYKVETYRSVYAKDGSLISSQREALSDYKSRDEVILRAPAAPSLPAGGDAPITITPVDPSTPVAPITPVDPNTPVAPITPVDPNAPPGIISPLPPA